MNFTEVDGMSSALSASVTECVGVLIFAFNAIVVVVTLCSLSPLACGKLEVFLQRSIVGSICGRPRLNVGCIVLVASAMPDVKVEFIVTELPWCKSFDRICKVQDPLKRIVVNPDSKPIIFKFQAEKKYRPHNSSELLLRGFSSFVWLCQ